MPPSERRRAWRRSSRRRSSHSAMSAVVARHGDSQVLTGRHRAAAVAARWVERNLRWILPAPAVAVMLLLMVFPLGYTAYLSLHQWYASSVLGPELVWFKNYADLLARDERFWPAFRVTCYFTTGA